MRYLLLDRPARRVSGARRLILVMVAAAAAVAVLAPSAASVPPTRTSGTFTSSTTMTGVCSFPVSVDSVLTFTETVYTNQSGALTRIYDHVIEQDTFSAHGTSMTGLPYTANIEFLFDSSGNLTHIFASGIVERLILPDGTLFLSAGRVDFTGHPGVAFLLTPDVGHSGNVAGFCAALS